MGSCKFHQKKILPYGAQDLYAVVADVSSYPDFLPGCTAAHILEEGQGFIRAQLTIGHGFFKESYISRVVLSPHTRIEVAYEKGPFSHLKNYWAFKAVDEQNTEVEFFIDFAFRNPFLQKAIQLVFDESAQNLMTAFEKRVRKRVLS